MDPNKCNTIQQDDAKVQRCTLPKGHTSKHDFQNWQTVR